MSAENKQRIAQQQQLQALAATSTTTSNAAVVSSPVHVSAKEISVVLSASFTAEPIEQRYIIVL
jgi:hypothetical protein